MMFCDLKNTLRIYKEGKISDLVLSRSLSDYIRPISPTTTARIVRADTQTNAGLLYAIQTLPQRKNGRLSSVIYIDQRTLMALPIDDFIDVLHKEVRNNTNYLKIFSKFLLKNADVTIDRSDAYAVLLEMYLISFSQMSPTVLKHIKESGAAFADTNAIQAYHDKLVTGQMSFLKAQEALELKGVPHWLTNCAYTIAVASGAESAVYDIDYSDVKIDTLSRHVVDVKNKEDKGEGDSYVADPGVHTDINNAADVEKSRGRFLYRPKNM